MKESWVQWLEEYIELPDRIRKDIMINIVTDYFSHFGCQVPDHVINDEAWFVRWEILLKCQDKNKVYDTILAFKNYAKKYHELNTPKIEIPNDVTKFTLIKIINKTWVGTRVDEMGFNKGSLHNVKNGFISKYALEVIIRYFEKEPLREDLKIAFGNKVGFIHDRLMELYK